MQVILNFAKKPWAISLMAITTFLLFFGFIGIDVAEASLRSKVTSGSGDELVNTIDKAGAEVVSIARQIAMILCVLLCVWMGYSAWVKKTAEGLADVKGRLVALAVGVGFVFFAESIVGTVLKMFGYQGAA